MILKEGGVEKINGEERKRGLKPSRNWMNFVSFEEAEITFEKRRGNWGGELRGNF